MTDSPRTRIVLSALAAALLVAGLVSAVSMSGDGGDGLVATGDRSSSTTAAAEAGSDDSKAGESDGDDDAAAGGDAATGEGSTPGSTAKQPTTTTKLATSGGTSAPQEQPSSGEPAQPQPTKAGSYTYEMTVDGETSEASYLVEPAQGGAGETRQVHTLKTTQGDVRNDLIWRADGLYLDKISGSGGQGMSGECDWQPDVLVRKIPLKVGVGWVADSGCSGESPYGPYTLKAHFEFNVTDTARLTIGGQAVDVWVIESSQHIDITTQYQGQQFTATQDATSKTFVSGKHGLSVREESQSTATTPMGQRSNTTTRQLKSLNPA